MPRERTLQEKKMVLKAVEELREKLSLLDAVKSCGIAIGSYYLYKKQLENAPSAPEKLPQPANGVSDITFEIIRERDALLMVSRTRSGSRFHDLKMGLLAQLQNLGK